MREVWDLARFANATGIPNDRLDAGSGWDGYHLYEYSRDQGITRARSPRGSPWWVYFYAKATDSSHVVAGKRLPGYVVVAERPYSSWLASEPTRLYLLRRPKLPPPPKLGDGGAGGSQVQGTPGDELRTARPGRPLAGGWWRWKDNRPPGTPTSS